MSKLSITGKNINLSESEILLQEDFAGSRSHTKWLKEGNIVSETGNGKMVLQWVSGEELNHGQIFSEQEFHGDIVMEFEAETVVPSDHDIIWWWNVQMADSQTAWSSGLLGALGGWFTNQAGIERISKKSSCLIVRTPLFKLEPGRKYRIQSGTIEDTSFLFVDGRLIVEFQQTGQPEHLSGRIGFGVYQSHFKISNLKVYKPEWTKLKTDYNSMKYTLNGLVRILR